MWFAWLACVVAPTPQQADPAALAKGAPVLLQVGGMEEAGTVGVRVVGAPANGKVKVFAGTKVAPGPCWKFLQGGCMGIKKPVEIANLVADATGSVRVDLPVVAAKGTLVPVQAVAEGSPPGLSNVVTRTVVGAGEAPPPLGSNVLIVLIDDLGVEKLAAYGSPTPAPTPTIDALAATGLTFEQAYTRTVCTPGRAALQTGRFGRRTGVGANWREDQPWELPPAQLTLAELGRLSPYYEVQSSYAGKWHLGTEVAESGYGHPGVQGWGWYAGAFANLYTIQDKYLSYFDWDKVVDGAVVDTTTYATTDTFDDAVARVGVMAEPWMLMVSTNATHLPLEAPPAELVPVDPPAGDGYTTRQMLEGIDTELARLLAAIPPEVLARTTIVLTTDNGTHRAEASDWVDPNRAKGTLFDGGVHVPLIVSGPAVAVPGSRSAAFVDLVDVFPTVAEWMGVDVGAVPAVLDATRPYAIDGVSLTPLLQDPTSAGRAFVYSELFGPPGPGPYTEVDRQMIRDEQYKLIVDNNSGKVMFFDYAGTRFEGPDLVVCGMDADQAAAYERLTLTLAGYTAELVYDAAPYPPEVADTGVDPDFPIDHDTGVQVCP